jgi:hypothetical protein
MPNVAPPTSRTSGPPCFRAAEKLWGRYEIELKRLPAFADDSPEQYQAMIAEILLEIEHKASPGAEISIHGQERVAETVRLARMNRRQSSGEAKPIGCFCGESGGSSRALT